MDMFVCLPHGGLEGEKLLQGEVLPGTSVACQPLKVNVSPARELRDRTRTVTSLITTYYHWNNPYHRR